ncbi:hypothetical protein RZN25_05080 [Bacillaceae bacterium S4-13-56]
MNFNKLVLLLLSSILLTGCMYPEEEYSKNQRPNEVQLEMMQKAVDQYSTETGGYLPIQNRDIDTPIFQKYPIDYSKLREYQLIVEPPDNSFEKGGVYQYVIIHAETDPTVKVIDLRLTDKIREYNLKIDTYRQRNQYPPYGERVGGPVFRIKYEQLGMDNEPYVSSPYTGNPLPVFINGSGELVIDYRPDIFQLLKEKDYSYKEGDDLRYLLTDHYSIVPAYSEKIVLKNGEPVYSN